MVSFIASIQIVAWLTAVVLLLIAANATMNNVHQRRTE